MTYINDIYFTSRGFFRPLICAHDARPVSVYIRATGLRYRNKWGERIFFLWLFDSLDLVPHFLLMTISRSILHMEMFYDHIHTPRFMGNNSVFLVLHESTPIARNRPRLELAHYSYLSSTRNWIYRCNSMQTHPILILIIAIGAHYHYEHI